MMFEAGAVSYYGRGKGPCSSDTVAGRPMAVHARAVRVIEGSVRDHGEEFGGLEREHAA
ncbi:MAG: hypothetical protein ABIH26_07455 [Candidatus Eisenbacteria bacterium]